MMERTTTYGTDTVVVAISSQDHDDLDQERRIAHGAKVIFWRYLLGVACVLGIAGGYTLTTTFPGGHGPPTSYDDYWTYSSSTFVAEAESSTMVALPATSAERAGNLPPAPTTVDHNIDQHRSLLLLRHAKSSWEIAANGKSLPDEQRPLLAQGVDDAKRLGIFLEKHDVPVPDIIYASPSVRTRQTLHLVQRHWAQNVPVLYLQDLFDDAIASSSYIDIIRRAINPAYHRVLLVGHNPAIQTTAMQLVVEKQDAMLEDFPTAGLVEIEWTSNSENKNDHVAEDKLDWNFVKEGNGRVTMFVTPSMT
jgi:phosphohistidine phosphatase